MFGKKNVQVKALAAPERMTEAEGLSSIDVFKVVSREKWWTWLVAIGLGGAGVALISCDRAIHTSITFLPPDVVHEFGVTALVASVLGLAVDTITLGTGKARKQIIFEEQLKKITVAAGAMSDYQNPHAAIKKNLAAILPGTNYAEFRSAISEIVSKVEELAKLDATGAKTPVDVRYFVEFLAWATRRQIGKLATSMHTLIRAVADDGYAAGDYESPTRFELNRRLLAAQMKSLLPTDRYDSIANVRLYFPGKRDEYERATLAALKRGVRIRRLYNLCLYEDKNCDSFLDAKKVVDLQLDQFGQAGTFEARFLTRAILTDARVELQPGVEAISVRNVAELDRLYYGLFFHRDLKVLFYRTYPANLDSLNVTSSDVGDIHTREAAHIELFETLWRLCDGVTNPL